MNAIFTRRSVRTFSGKKIEDEKIDKILRAAMQAPSAYNQQPWEFIVVRNKKTLERLSQSNEYAGSLADADVGIIIIGNTQRMRLPEMADQDLGACTQNLLIQVADLDLGAVWYGTAPIQNRMQFIQKEFNLGKHQLPYSMIGIGYPKNPNANVFLDRYDSSRITYID